MPREKFHGSVSVRTSHEQGSRGGAFRHRLQFTAWANHEEGAQSSAARSVSAQMACLRVAPELPAVQVGDGREFAANRTR